MKILKVVFTDDAAADYAAAAMREAYAETVKIEEQTADGKLAVVDKG